MRLAQAGARLTALRVAPAFLLVALLVSGCNFLGIGSSGGVSGSGPITVAVVPGIDNAPLQVAVTEGLFRQNGLNVVVKDYPSIGAEYRALTSGQAQVAAGDYTDFFYMQSSGGAKLRLIADGYDAVSNSMAILTLPNSGITTPQQLQGLPGGVAAAPAQLVQAGKAVPFNIQDVVDHVYGRRGGGECHESEQRVAEAIVPAERRTRQRRGEHQQVLRPLAGPGALPGGEQPARDGR